MTKLRRGRIIKISLALVAVMAIIFIACRYETMTDKTNNPNTTSQTEAVLRPSEDVSISRPNPEENIKKCFPKYSGNNSLKELKDKITAEYDFPEADEDAEEYRLIGPEKEDYRIHYIKDAPRDEMLRVFLVGRDEMPDLVKNYPKAQSNNLSERLEGALQLGTLQKKIIKMKSQLPDGLVLEFEEEFNDITRVHFVDQKNELNCDGSGCHCTQY